MKKNILIIKHTTNNIIALHQEMQKDSETANNRLEKMMAVLKAMLSSTREGTKNQSAHWQELTPQKLSPAVPALTARAAVNNIPGRGHPDPGHGIGSTAHTP